ncbi:MAG: glycosyltransferase family 2 protein [Symploca sp. SIO1C4]|uniref:Glycosyltransferase family 2 protein n=1 Tax=Symploca sp. SIO1C4 TaxID=2607765 RepID=A0A6B3NJB8_9CYAN|nr:glycosyltransferase family 2 protein [Symploca sp. SIO1C4]
MSNQVQPDNRTRLLVSIVNYRVPNLTIDCLHSLVSEVQALPGTKVVVVDNNSGDDSVKQISAAIKKNGWEDWASLIQSKQNGGYSFGNNLAIRPTLRFTHPPSYFMILNPDTQVRTNAFKALLDFMEQHLDVGIAGCSFETVDGEPKKLAFRFPSVLSELDSSLRLGIVTKLLSNWVVPRTMGDEACQVDWVPGTAMLVRRQVFESVGLMDEEYFLFYEETDLCLRAKRAGWSCWYVPQSRIMNIGGQSRKKDNSSHSKRRPQYWFESRRRYFLNNHGLLYAVLADAAWILGFVLLKWRWGIQNKSDTDPPKLFNDFLRNSVFFKGGVLRPIKTK